MPRGAPDYSNVRATEQVHRLDDLAELAARLGSPDIYDRAGRLVFMTDFRYGLQGATLGTNSANSTGNVVAERSLFSPYSIKMDPSDEASSYVELRHQVYCLVEGKLAFETYVSLSTSPTAVYFLIYTYDGSLVSIYQIRYYPATGIWQIVKSDGTYETFLTGVKLQTSATAWHPVKLVVDPANDVYVRVSIGKHVVDLSSYGVYKYANTALAQMEVGVKVVGDAATHAPIYVASFIVTQNEP